MKRPDDDEPVYARVGRWIGYVGLTVVAGWLMLMSLFLLVVFVLRTLE